MTIDAEVAVLGSGAVALAHALFQARYGPVVLAGQESAPIPAVERVPAPLLTLLLELGIVPAELDVDRLTRERVVAWEDPTPAERLGPACAHLDRGALVDAMWWRVHACPDIRVVPPITRRDQLEQAGWRTARLVDATGRRALTAPSRIHPSPVWVATCCTVLRHDLDPTMRLAAGPGGYGYRLGSARWLTVGWVGPDAPPRDGAEVGRRISREGAGWLIDDVDLGQAQIVRRVASVAVLTELVTQNRARRGFSSPVPVVAIGDAALGRDALASQGVAIGLSDARLAAGADCGGAERVRFRHADGLDRHLDHVTAMLATCRHREAPAWLSYRRWLEEQRVATATAAHRRG